LTRLRLRCFCSLAAWARTILALSCRSQQRSTQAIIRAGQNHKYKWCAYGLLGREITRYTVIYRVGQNHIYTVYIRYFWQGNHQIYGRIGCIYTVLANPSHIQCIHTALANSSKMYRKFYKKCATSSTLNTSAICMGVQGLTWAAVIAFWTTIQVWPFWTQADLRLIRNRKRATNRMCGKVRLACWAVRLVCWPMRLLCWAVCLYIHNYKNKIEWPYCNSINFEWPYCNGIKFEWQNCNSINFEWPYCNSINFERPYCNSSNFEWLNCNSSNFEWPSARLIGDHWS